MTCDHFRKTVMNVDLFQGPLNTMEAVIEHAGACEDCMDFMEAIDALADAVCGPRTPEEEMEDFKLSVELTAKLQAQNN